MARQFFLGLSVLLLGAAFSASVQAEPRPPSSDVDGVDFFEKKIRPLLANHCYGCHSAQAKKLRGGLHLDSPEGILAGGNTGPEVVPGNADRSRLIVAVRYADPDLRMPPRGRLRREEVADLEAWVQRGAPMPSAIGASQSSPARKHWAFQQPLESVLPRVRRGDWVKNPIDRFILAKVEEKGLSPAPAADKRTLLRRVTYDLTGLPPSPQEVDAFLADNSPDAFATVVKRLLESPQYGERWGRRWLDLVRYTDDFDEAWRYRDWVVSAFNRDLPYDQFLIEQIAGDRLAAAAPGQVNAAGITATTMLSIGQWGGIDRRKRCADIVDDQIDTISRSFLGLTLACARCHNHKFDPITTADYYGLAGIFYSSRVISDSVYLSHGTTRLSIPLVPPAEVEKHDRHAAQTQRLERRLQTAVETCYAAYARTLLPHTSRYLLAAWDYQHWPSGKEKPSIDDFAKSRGLQAFALSQWSGYLEAAPLAEFRPLSVPVHNFDGEKGIEVWGASAERPWWGVNTTDRETPIETFLLPARSMSVNPGVEGGTVGWKSPITGKVKIEGKLTDADPHDGVGVNWAIDLVRGKSRRELSSGTLPNGGSRRLQDGRFPERLAGVDVKSGDMVYLQVWLHESDAHYDITNVEFKITRLDGPGEWDLVRDALRYLPEGNPHRDSLGHAGVWRYDNMAGSQRRQRMPAGDALLQSWRKTADEAAAGKQDRKALEKITGEVQRAIDSAAADSPVVQDLVGIRSPFWVNGRDDSRYLSAGARAELGLRAAIVEAFRNTTPALPCAHGAQEGGPRFSLFPGIQDARIHIRGNYAQLGQVVPRHFPACLAGDRQPSITSGSGRLELARWIGSADNPLTARVMVNRIWQHHFGEGIVRTPSNFGRLGSAPTHPELLDWLARRFVESGWSVKAMHRLMLLSAAYQQSSQAPARTLQSDPDNLLFGRMNRQRLEAEALRDSILLVSGRLDLQSGGGPEGDDSMRRTLYVKVSRADCSGFGRLFDGANASMHVEKRTTSTVAPQALYLMNGPLVLDSLHHLLSRPEIAGGKPAERIWALYRLLFGRVPAPEEIDLGKRFIEFQMAHALVGPPPEPAPLTTWETYAQALLLSNEFLFVD
jgi:hypothetical protein